MKKYGLIGYPLGHSFSKTYFTRKFEQENIDDCIYDLYPLANIDDVRLLFEVEKDLCGLNVTIPYKETVIEYLDDLDEAARKIGAVNCIKLDEIGRTGYNTDYPGFRDSILPLIRSHHTKALVLGTGGASKAVVYGLHELGIETKYVSRKITPGNFTYADLNKSILDEHTVIVNTTPLGMYPNTQDHPAIPYEHLTPSHLCFDLVYNPERTIFMEKAAERGSVVKNGLEMLEMQADYAWKIWNRAETA